MLICICCVWVFLSSSTPSTPVTNGALIPSTNTISTQKPDTSTQLQSCLSDAANQYTASWQNNCQSNYAACIQGGVSLNQCTLWWGGTCSLGNTVANQLLLNLQRAKTDCFREY